MESDSDSELSEEIPDKVEFIVNSDKEEQVGNYAADQLFPLNCTLLL